MRKTIELDDGKYTIVYNETNQYPEKCLRNGEEWRNLVGDNLIYWLCAEIEKLSIHSPLKVEIREHGYWGEKDYYCPRCHKQQKDTTKNRRKGCYCERCGQKLVWGKE